MGKGGTGNSFVSLMCIASRVTRNRSSKKKATQNYLMFSILAYFLRNPLRFFKINFLLVLLPRVLPFSPRAQGSRGRGRG